MLAMRRFIRYVLAVLFVAVATLATSQITHDATATMAVLICTGVLALAWAGRRIYRRYYRRRRGW